MKDWTYQEAIEKADAVKALNLGEIYLNKGEKPWHIVDGCKPGSSHRLEIRTNVWFSGTDPTTGLRFRGSFDIEPRSANGKGSYEIDAAACRDVLEQLSGDAREKFQTYLADCAEKVAAKADEWRSLVAQQDRDAAILRKLAYG